MRKIGQTSTGSVVVEMTRAQFEALTSVIHPIDPTGQDRDEPDEVKPLSASAPAMVIKKRLNSVRTCLEKIRPASRTELVHTIRLVCKHTGGIAGIQIEHMIQILEKENFLILNDDNGVAYPWHEKAEERLKAEFHEEPLASDQEKEQNQPTSDPT